MKIWIPERFVEASLEGFEDYLLWCQDYTRDCFCDGEYYEFRDGRRFAVVTRDKHVWVDPRILKCDHP